MHEVFDLVFEVSSFPRFQYLELFASFGQHSPSRPYWSLLYVDKGAVVLQVDGVERTMENGLAILCAPEQRMELSVPPDGAANLYLIGFTLEKGDLTPYARGFFTVTGELRAQIKLLLKEAKFAYYNDLRDPDYKVLQPSADRPFGTEQMMKLLLEQFLIHMVRGMLTTEERSYPEIVRENLLMVSMGANPCFDTLLNYLEQNMDRHLTIEDVCRDNFISRSRVQRVFQECVGEGIISFHSRLKIEYSKLMIRKSTLNFTQIAEALGFSSVHHFSKKFKQLVKMSPSDYVRFAK